MAATAATAEAAAKRLTRYEQILDANRRPHDAPRFSDDDVLDAVEHVAAARIDDARARRQAAEAKRAYEEAVSAERAQRRAKVRHDKRTHAARLHAALEAVVVENEKAQGLDEAEYEVLSVVEREVDALSGGAAFPRLAWRELTRARLDAWCSALKAEGVLD
jgi:hypothetical protein